MSIKNIFLIGTAILLFFPALAVAVDTAPKITDREIIERLTRLEEGQKAILREINTRFESIDTRFESIDTRFESIDTRFESIDTRFESIDKQLDRQYQLILGIMGIFAAMFASTIGFALWDRRTMIRPFEIKVKAIEEEFASDRNKLHALIEAFQSLGQSDEKAAQILKRFNLL